VDPELRKAVSTIEAEGGVRAAAAAVDPAELAQAHARYAAERDAALPPGHAGPRPSGGVGGTRQGGKCLHAHLAWPLAGGDDRVRMTATSAARDAANRDDFFSAAEDAVGTKPELLTGQEEARLSFRGATAELDPAAGPFLVVDIGGGSTEFAAGSGDGEPDGA